MADGSLCEWELAAKHAVDALGADGSLKGKNGKSRFDLKPNMLRDFHRIQETAREAVAKWRRVDVAKVDWALGSLHDLRKSWCTHLAARIPMNELRELAGHADISTTANFDTRTTAETFDRVRKALSA